MRALLLAAGIGSRLRPITETVPKCLVPIHGRPLLDYWLNLIFGRDLIERAVINTHYLVETVEAHVAASPWCDRIDLVYEPELLGTGGTLKANRALYGDDDGVLVAHADNLTDFDVADPTEVINLAGVTNITDFTDLVTNHLGSNLSGDAVITDGFNSITLTNVAQGDLTINEFSFV